MNLNYFIYALGSFAMWGYAQAMTLPLATNAYFGVQQNSALYRRLSLEHPVRILLAESPHTEVHWKLACDGGFSLYDPKTGRIKRLDDKVLMVSHDEGSLYYNSQKIERSHFFVIPRSGFIQLNGVPYSGIFSLDRTSEATYLVNHLGLETYIESVLPYESVPTWPDEVQKALCIACRTYAVAKVTDIRTLGRDWHYPYDLKCSVMDQVYKGHERGVDLKRIIDATKGLILTHDKKPILAMYSAVCGGVIPAEKQVPIFEGAPYLKRPYACMHCKEQKYYRWENTIPFIDIEEPLRKEFPELKSIKAIGIEGFDTAGIAQHFVITDSHNKEFRIKAPDFRMLFYKDIKSICCEIAHSDKALQIKGKGYGHHIGLCQWGAYFMDLQGYMYKAILSYFYPGTTLTSLKKGFLFKN